MAEVDRYTRAEVAQRNGKNNAKLWIIVKDIVYDVTAYIHEHPAGAELILEYGGMDATKDFNSEHSSDAKEMLVKHKIGEIIEEEKHYDANGKKKKGQKAVESTDAEKASRGCMSIITCGLLG